MPEQDLGGDRRPNPAAAAPADDGARSTMVLILSRLGLGKLSALDPKILVVRYERGAPGAMIHLDIKKLGRPQTARRSKSLPHLRTT
jgi:hypothetical protein